MQLQVLVKDINRGYTVYFPLYINIAIHRCLSTSCIFGKLPEISSHQKLIKLHTRCCLLRGYEFNGHRDSYRDKGTSVQSMDQEGQ